MNTTVEREPAVPGPIKSVTVTFTGPEVKELMEHLNICHFDKQPLQDFRANLKAMLGTSL